MPTPTQMKTSDFNLEKLNTKELSEHVRGTIQDGRQYRGLRSPRNRQD